MNKSRKTEEGYWRNVPPPTHSDPFRLPLPSPRLLPLAIRRTAPCTVPLSRERSHTRLPRVPWTLLADGPASTAAQPFIPVH